MAPYQGWIGVVFAIWGLWGIISCILSLNLLTVVPVYWVLWLLVSVVEAGLGFILGYGLINQYILSRNEQAAEKGKELLAKLIPLQGTLGIVAIVLGVLEIIASILWRIA